MGPIVLRLALLAGVLAAVAGWPLDATRRRHRVTLVAAALTTGAVVAAVVVLGRAFWQGDYSLAYVADHSRRAVSPA